MSDVTPLQIPGLGLSDQNALDALLLRLNEKSPRNTLRRRYYDHKNQLRDLGIAIPPPLRSVETVVGWPAKGVDVLSRRVQLNGFDIPGGDTDSMGVTDIWDENRLDLESQQAHTSAMIHATAFLAVTAGDVTAGEPAALITARSAQYATGFWDARRRGLSSALSILSTDDDTGAPDHMVMYVPNRAIIMRREGTRWDLRQSVHDMGVPVELLPYSPMLDRPFGRSRISRAVMSLTDSAVRTLLRTEVSAEIFSAPQRYVLGADEEAFVDENGEPVPAWKAILGRILALSRDEDGNLPAVGHFPQQSMEPHIAQMRGLAALFASETNLSLTSLGVVQDNPSSAQAMEALERELILEAEACDRTFGHGWERSMRNALAIRGASRAERVEYSRLRSQWRNPAAPSISAAADATAKLVAARVLSPDSEVTYDGVGFSEPQRETLRVEARARRLEAMTANLRVAATAAGAPAPAVDTDAAVSG
jgi:hypothetical protein